MSRFIYLVILTTCVANLTVLTHGICERLFCRSAQELTVQPLLNELLKDIVNFGN